MKTSKIRYLISSAVLAAAIVVGGVLAAGAATWTGASLTGSKLWSEPNNWDTFLVPTASESVTLTNRGSTNVLGAVDNIVAANTTVNGLSYLSKVSFISLTTNYHTTLIQPGVTLTIDRGTTAGSMMYIGDWDPLSHDNQYYYTVVGPGASLVAGNFSAPVTNQGLQVTATYRSAANHVGSLNLSGLDNFAFAGGYFWVGINGGNAVDIDRPAGRVFLARTNLIVLAGNEYDALSLGSFRVGESRGNTPLLPSLLELGQENTFYTPWLKIGGARNGSGSYMYFRSGLVNPTLKLRGSDGVSRLGTLRIADNSWSTASSTLSRGFVDLTGGTIDARVDTAFVGYSQGGTLATSSGGAEGALTWTAGTFDINTLSVGYQNGNNPGLASGTVNVLGPTARLVAGRIILGRDAGNAAGGGVGNLNIDGGTVEILTDLAEDVVSGSTVSSTVTITNNGTLNLQPEGDATPATATIDTLNFSGGTVTNGTLALTTINVFSPATAFTAYPGTVLNPGTVGAPATLAVNGGLALNGAKLTLDLASSGSLDQIAISAALSLSGVNSVEINLLNPVTPGNFTLMTYGSLTGTAGNLAVAGPIADSRYTVSFDTTAPNVSMNIGGSAANLLWSGGNNGNAWNIKTTANWNSGAEQFYTYDAVEFSDAGSSTPAVNLVGTLLPGGVTFSAASKDYTFAGTGKISGFFGLTLSGSSILTVLTTNDYKGTTDINNGTLVLGDGATADGALGSGAVNNSATLVFNPAGTPTNASVITGSGSVLKRGPGVTRLSGANTFTGPLTVEAGILQAGSSTALGSVSGTATINSGATLDLGGNTLAKPIMASGAGVNGAGAIINSGSAQSLRDVQLGADTTFGGASAWTIGSSAVNSTDPGLTAYGYKLSKVGGNQVKVNGLRSAPWDLQLGEVDVQQGVLSLYGIISLGSQTGKAITVRTNATLELGNYPANILTKTYSLDDGACLFVQGTNSAIDGSVTLGGKTAFDVLGARALSVNCPIGGTGPLVKGIGYHPSSSASTGTGALVLAAANTFTGDLRIETGSVVLTNSASVAAANIILAGGSLSTIYRTDSTLTLSSGQALKGSGSILGSVSSPIGSTIAPSATNGVLAITGALTLRGTTIMDLNRTGSATNSSRITVTGTLNCGGALVLTSSGQAFQAGDTFSLFGAGTLLNPFQTSAITWPSLASGLYWTNRISIDGKVAVAVSPEPATPPTLSVSVTNSHLFLQWPTDYTSYALQGQTNAIGVGLSTNWRTVTGTVGNQITIPLDPANGSVFYRLMR